MGNSEKLEQQALKTFRRVIAVGVVLMASGFIPQTARRMEGAKHDYIGVFFYGFPATAAVIVGGVLVSVSVIAILVKTLQAGK